MRNGSIRAIEESGYEGIHFEGRYLNAGKRGAHAPDLLCPLDAADLEAALSGAEKPAAVYLTSPDYLGQLADLEALSRICRKRNVLLLVDNAHGAYLRVVTHESEGLGGDLVEVGIVVESPLGAEHDDKLASLAILGGEEHDAYGGGVDPRASTGKDIDALVHDGGPPPFVPEGLVVIAVAVGPHNGHLQVLWDEHPEDYDSHEDQECI